MKLRVYHSQEDALRDVSAQLIEKIQQHRSPFHVALSGANTAQKLFNLWRTEYQQKIPWDLLRFYWVDERCVEPTDDESNFKHADELLFRPLNIPTSHIHRIHGERDPETEAAHYSEMIKWELPGYSCLPRFDAIILGIGEDGHVASIFPGFEHLLTDKHCYAVTENPYTKQKRISMTGELILNSKMILIPVIGSSKVGILRKVISELNSPKLPASYIIANARDAIIYTDAPLSVE